MHGRVKTNEVITMTKIKDNTHDAREAVAALKDDMPAPAGKDIVQLIVDPFGKDVETDDLFKHKQLKELQALLKVSIESKAGMLVTGPSGSGKTTGVRSVTDELPANRYSVVYLGQDRDGTNVLRRFVGALGLTAKRYHAHLSLQASQWLLDNLESGGKEIALVVDEAHLLSDQLLEDLRLMTNANYDRKSPLALILVGQPVLRLRLKSPDFESLSQRLRYRFRVEGLSQDETADYINRRLLAAGLAANLFPQEVIQFLFHITEGLPRRINNLCSLALLRARAEKRATIDLALLKEIVELD
jgi:type II secretory pathway predicted ATPase ExeA